MPAVSKHDRKSSGQSPLQAALVQERMDLARLLAPSGADVGEACGLGDLLASAAPSSLDLALDWLSSGYDIERIDTPALSALLAYGELPNAERLARLDGRLRLLLAYLEAQDRYLKDGDVEGFSSSFYSQAGPMHMDLTQSVGRHLGAQLQDAMLDERIDRLWIRDLWFEPFHLDGSPLRFYLETLEMLVASESDASRPGEAERL